MIVSHAQALKLCCPYTNGGQTYCRGSNCMLWMWEGMGPFKNHLGPLTDPPTIDEPQRPAIVPKSFKWIPPDTAEGDKRGVWIEPEDEHAARRTGTCGTTRRG